MNERIEKWLYDILEAINEIDSFFGDTPKQFADFSINRMLKSAVERKVEIIGEAVNRILRADPDFKITAARQIVNTRNYISHSYDNVSSETMWGIIINHLPPLKAEIERLLAQ